MKTTTKPVNKKPPSPIARVRRIAPLTRLLLFVRAGGRCEFDGHNKYLLRHSMTLTEGNFAHMAHIVAFSPKGPRGRGRLSTRYLNTAANLMLLCHECHKLIDNHPERYTVTTLRRFKQRHEERMLRLTGSSPDHQTKVVLLQANIGRQPVEITPGEIQEAVAPRYPDAEPLIIDLTGIADGDDQAFWETAKQTIAGQIERLYSRRLDGPPARHISLFALAPIPLLVFSGTQLSSKIPVDLYQRHRDPETWTWKATGEPVRYVVRTLRTGSDCSKVALLLSLSGSVKAESLPPEIDERFSIYEITLADAAPYTGFLRLRQDLLGFQRVYQEVLATIVRNHGLVDEIHLFPAVPAPVAVLCGREPLPKVHPALVVYDFNKEKGGFRPTIRTNQP